MAKVLSWLSMYESFIYVGGDCLDMGVTGNIGDRELGMDMGDMMRDVIVREGAGVIGGHGSLARAGEVGGVGEGVSVRSMCDSIGAAAVHKSVLVCGGERGPRGLNWSLLWCCGKKSACVLW